MPCFNGSNFLNTSITSVLDQTYQDFELIIIDDGSSDNSISIINNFVLTDKRIKITEVC